MIGYLCYKNYKPLKLEKGMFFLNKEHNFIHSLEKIPLDKEEYIKENGYPIEIFVEYDNNKKRKKNISQEQIGWMDLGDEFDTLVDISIRHLNTILQQYESLLEFDYIEETDYPELYLDKVIIHYPEMEI